ncbi:MAG: hypothetical protein QHH30_08015, partial [candidate division NC10 bacterium]|nr:hypothetical protein [candidate division NC10 bacterium]
MAPRIFLIAILITFSFIVFFAHHNRSSVVVDLSTFGRHEVPLTVLVIVPLLAGILITLLFSTIYDLQRTLSFYRESRDARRNERIREIYAQGMNSFLAQR